MESALKSLTNRMVWQQFGAAIDMLENAINACPVEVWGDRNLRPEFWYVTYHTLFFLDYYLADSEDGFKPPAPFTLSELDPSGLMPDRVYTQPELLTYLEFGREKLRSRLAALSEDEAARDCGFARRDMSVMELMLYNMRHVQHHTAQLNMLLRQTIDSAPKWVSKARQPLMRA